MHLKEEIDLLDQHSRSAQLVVANLVAAREWLAALPKGQRRERLLALQQQAIEAARRSLDFSESTLTHLRSLESFYVETVAGPNGR